MNIIYIASVFDDECIKRYFNGDYVLSYAASKYNTLLFSGIVANGAETEVISVVPINRGIYKKLILKGYKVKKENLRISYLSQVNFPVLKNIFNFVSAFFKTLFAAKNSAVIYDVLVISASAGALAAAKLRGFKRVGIITDLPKFQPVSRSKFMLRINDNVVNSADAYVFLTQQMNDEVNSAHKPYLVLEGHVDSQMIAKEHLPFSTTEKRIIYAGSVEKIYGIEMLCKAFLSVAKQNEKLLIYGNGDYAEELRKLSSENENIIYYGNRPNDEIVSAELDATLLVNPRPTDGEYTKYSFPSKTLEYMVSGTPVLSSHLAGIPKEYENYIFYFDDNTAESLGKRMREVLDLPVEELAKKGASARNFVLENKTNLAQAKKIVEFISEHLLDEEKYRC